jgi:hypothetical protein
MKVVFNAVKVKITTGIPTIPIPTAAPTDAPVAAVAPIAAATPVPIPVPTDVEAKAPIEPATGNVFVIKSNTSSLDFKFYSDRLTKNCVKSLDSLSTTSS